MKRGRGFGRAVAAGAVALALALASTAFAQPRTDDGVVLFLYPDSTAQTVFLAGDFNGFSPTATPLDREAEGWATRVFLDAGTYEYQFVVDGSAVPDPGNPEMSPAGRSVVRVGGDGQVLPPRAAPAGADSLGAGAGGSRGNLAWQLRYLGFATARRDRVRDRFDLDRPLHDIDLKLDARLDDAADAWILLHADNRDSTTALEWDRGLFAWRPGNLNLRVFDNTGVTEFETPGALVGRVGRYADAFGFGRRGAHARRRIFGAPFEALYADDVESGANVPPATALPDLHGGAGDALADRSVRRYVRSSSDRGQDTGALRGRLGTEAAGLGFGLRVDRGAAAGRLADLAVRRLPGDTLVAFGRELRTTETWGAWSLDLRGRMRGVRGIVEFMSGTLRARAAESSPVVRLRAAPGAMVTEREIGSPDGNSDGFDLDTSRRVIVHLDGGRPAGVPVPWSARPGTGRVAGPSVQYDYEEHDFSALPSGAPVLMRRHGFVAGYDRRVGSVALRLDLEHHWFRIPEEADWQQQFWLRSGNFWLDEDVVSIDRATLLGTRRAAVARLHAAVAFPQARGLRVESHTTWAAPGFDAGPRHVEEVLRVAVPVAPRVELRAHSRLAVYRRFAPIDSAGVARLGAGARIEAGEFDLAGVAVRRSHRAFAAHFVECVYAVSSRADVALGFGVDPWVVYDVTNEYAPIGWDEFLLDAVGRDFGAGPERLGRRLEDAERALERERRVTLEARLRF